MLDDLNAKMAYGAGFAEFAPDDRTVGRFGEHLHTMKTEEQITKAGSRAVVEKPGSARPLYAHMRNFTSADEDGTSINVGAKIRKLRKSMKLTLEDLSLRANMSIGYISQIERDISSPTLNALQIIARSLNVNISYFFSDMNENNLNNRYIIRREDRRFLSFVSGLKECQLNTSETPNLQVLYCVFKPGASVDDAYSHDGEECGVIMSGSIEISIDGETFTLEEGDSFSFPSAKMHHYRNAGDKPALIIWAMTPPSY